MNILDLIYKLHNEGTVLWSEKGLLKYRQYQEYRDFDKIMVQIKNHKTAIVELLELNGINKIPELGKALILKTGNNKAELSYAQKRMYFIEKYNKGSKAYNIPTMIYELEIKENWQEEALKDSLHQIVSRHEILRTLIKEDKDGKDYQEVQDLNIKKFLISTKQLETKEELREQLVKDSYHVYELDTEYPIRAAIYNVKEQKYLSIVIHHIAFDGWSIEIFLQELRQHYKQYASKALGRRNAAKLQDLKIQYKDFAVWQKNRIQGSLFQKELDYWCKQLIGYESLNLELDKPRPKEIDYKGAKEFFELEVSSSNALRQLAMHLEVSLYSLLLAAYCLALRAHTGQEDIVIGTPAANRHHESVRELIGLFVNTLVLRISVKGSTPISHYIRDVGELVRQAQLHQDLPFEKLVEELVKEKDTSRHPLFQVVFALENFASGVIPIKCSDTNIDLENLESIIRGYYPEDIYNISKFDLSMFIDDSCNNLKGNVEYAVSLFETETIKRFILTYVHILQQLAQYNYKQLEHIQIRDIEYLPDKQKIIYDWNITSNSYLLDKNLKHLIEKQVQIRPDSIAALFENKHLTYSELNNKANQLASYLRLHGITAESIVAILTEKSIEFIIAIMSSIKAGAGYVPIDPSYPKERIFYILNDSKTKIILTKQTFKNLYEGFTGKAVWLDNFAYTKYSDKNTDIDVVPQSLAYIIYTSGSTGNPKGVLIDSQGLLNTLVAVNEKFNINSSDTSLVLSSLTFDLSVYDILGLLIAGGKIAIPTESQDAAYWSRIVKEQQVTIWNTVPQLAKVWGYHEELFLAKYNLNKIRLFLLSGDSIPNELPEQLKKITNSNVVSLGGATEASIWSIWHEYQEQIPILYGKPMPNQQMYILDDNMEPTPPGVRGIIYIGGAGLARGYLGKSELTAEKFMANPFAKGRIYYTGDVGKFTSDGNITFLGRKDNQVKLRGYRVELGEIEAVLNRVSSVKQAIVLANEEQLLLAYITLEKSNIISNIEPILHQKCKETLPHYMQPHDIIIIDEFPITSNGKIDRNKLLQEYKPIIKTSLEAPPQEGIEQTLANILSELLRIEKVSRHDNFFRLGGDSIISIQMVSRARKEGINIDIKQIFNTPIIMELAKYARIATNNTFEPEQGEFELLPIQQWFFTHHTDIHHFNQAVWFITNQDLSITKLEQSINQVRANHGAFRLRFNKRDIKWIQHYEPELSNLQLKIEDTKLNKQRLIEAIDKIHKSLDITNGPIDRIIWFNGYGLLWVIHHLIIDGVSWKILLDDLNAAYLDKALSPKSNSYKDWSACVQNYRDLDKVCIFYSQNDIQLLCNHSCNSRYIREIPIKFSQDITKKFIREANKCYNTLSNDLLLTALKLAIGDITNDYGISIDLEGHGREVLDKNIDLSATVGWFTAIYPVTFKIANPDNLASAIKTVKKHLREIPHNGLSYAIAVQRGKITDQNSSILFNYLGQLDSIGTPFRFGNYTIGHSFSKKNKARYMIEINGAIKNDVLSFVWQHCEAVSRDYVLQVISRFEKRFIEIICHCTDYQNYVSDFDIDLGEDELAYIMELIK
jgi:amino acid adenylation domain-containing protein/non-ribosomal peptide synthase protein (TIGR01720 family)